MKNARRVGQAAFLGPLLILPLLTGCTGGEAGPSATPAIATPARAGSGPDADGTRSDHLFELGRVGDHLILPEDLIYEGAFRLPDVAGASNFEYSGYAMTFYPEGDPGGPADGHPGSLFLLGHDHHQLVAEIDIPAPVISRDGNPAALNTASVLQGFADITDGMFGQLEIPRAGLAYLPAQGAQTAGRLYFGWGQHFQFELWPSHGWSELDLSDPQPAGPWFVGDYTNYVTGDYLFAIPEAWANEHAPGMLLATGRFRDGTWSGFGPTLFTIAPWTEGDPPPPGATLEKVIPLLLYGEPVRGSPEIAASEHQRMLLYSEADEWSGGVWATAGSKSAVIFVGTKALGNAWYGFANGVVYPTSGDPDEEVPEVPPWPYDDRGWWSEDISAQLIFYDPLDLAAVARGDMETWGPQPYAALVLDEYLFDGGYDFERGKRYLVGAAAFDAGRSLLYLVERRADEERSLIHVFSLRP